MGTQVDLGRLADALENYTYAYLMTTNADGHPHAVAVRTTLVDGQLLVSGFGWRSRDNAMNQHVVALVYPPMVEGGYSLIIDGESNLRGQDLIVTPTVAILHRPPRAEDPPPESGCVSDCQRLEYET